MLVADEFASSLLSTVARGFVVNRVLSCDNVISTSVFYCTVMDWSDSDWILGSGL